MGSGSIYKIITNQGVYVGKWNDETVGFMTQHHLPRALPWKNIAKDAWEVSWRESLRQFGWNNGSYFQDIQQWSEDAVIANLKRTFKNCSLEPDAFWDDIVTYWWKKGHERDVAEALCIMLATKESSILNTQIDFLTRDFTGKNVEVLLSVDELNRRAFAANKNIFNVEVWVSISAEDVEEELAKSFENAGFKRVNLFNNKKFTDAITNIVSKHTIERIIDSLKNVKDKVQKNKVPGRVAIRKSIDELIQRLNSSGDASYQEIIKIVKDGLKEARQQSKITDLLKGKTKASAAQFIEQLTDWLKKTNLSDVLNGGKPVLCDNQSTMGKGYKKMFTNFIQETIFYPIPTNPNRAELNRNRIEFSIDNNAAFSSQIYRPNYSNSSSETLKSKTQQNPAISQFVFVLTNWDKIYPEQVKLWQHIKLGDYSLEEILPEGEYVEKIDDVKIF